MDLLIRDVDPMVVKKIDQWAKEKGLSRQEYLKEHLETFAVNDLHMSILDDYKHHLNVNTVFLEKTSKSMDDLIDVLKEFMFDE